MKLYNKNTLVKGETYTDVNGEYMFDYCTGDIYVFHNIIRVENLDNPDDFDNFEVDERDTIRHSNELRFY